IATASRKLQALCRLNSRLGEDSGGLYIMLRRSEREVDICTRSLGSGWLTRDGLRFCLLSYSFSFADGLSGFTADPGRAGDSLLVDSDTLPGEPSLMEPDIPEAPPVLPNVT